MRKFNYIVVFFVVCLGLPAAAQIQFFEGSYAEALQKAKTEKKELFVDFWAGWCGPCKMMATEVFTDKEVGEYFNKRFVAVQLDVENAANKQVVARFQVEALPTLLFIGRDDKEIRRLTGAKEPQELLHEAKVVAGEELSYEQLYAKYKKDKKDFATQQQLLIEAQGFMMTQEGYNREKWGTRIDNLFDEYLKNKKLKNMINPEDFYILNIFHPVKTVDDPIFDFIVANHEAYMKAVDTVTISRYIVRMNNTFIIQLCKLGNVAYRESIKRVNGDLKPLYAGFSFGSLSVEEAITLLADATYYLYRHDLPKFFDNMEKYFAGKGNAVELSDYTEALENLAIAYEEEMPDQAYPRCIPWIGKALEIQAGNSPETRTRLLMMLGQCFQHMNEPMKAKQSMNQAFLESAQISHPREKQEMQAIIRQSLESLGQ